MVLTLFTVGIHPCFSQTIEVQKERIKKLESDIKFLDQQIALTQSQQKSTLNELVLLQSKVASRRRLLIELDKEIQAQSNDIDLKNKTIKTLEQRLDTLNFYYNHLIRSTYKNRDSRTWFMYILAADNIEQGYRRWSYLKNYSRSITKQVKKIQDTKTELIVQKEKLARMKEDNMKIQASREQEYIGLTKEEQHSRLFAKTLAKKQKEYRTQLTKKRQEADRLNKEVERMIAAEIAAAAKLAEKEKGNTAAAPAAAANVKLSGDFTANKGKLPWPVSQGVIIESFGEHNHPTLPNVKMPFNNGVNISAPKNSAVTVVFDGIVKQIIAIPGYNQCILVQHGTYFTFYCKLANVSVKVGDNIKTGTVLGSLEDSQNTSVLHFELWNGTTKQNPEYWLRKL
ncbi:MAG: peptidoglycan DD-metalloendopeptidase family protein [Bacteroidales bacterium]